MNENERQSALEGFCPEILHEIIRHLSFSERRFLKQCSKLLNEAATKAPIFFEEVKFTDGFYSQNGTDSFFIRLQLDGIELNFRETKGNEDEQVDTTMRVFVGNVQQANKTRIFEKSSVGEVAKKYLRDLVLQSNVTCGCFESNCRYEEGFLKDSEVIRSRKLRITESSDSGSAAPTDKWLKHLKPELLRFVNVYKANQFFSVAGCEKQLCYLKTLHVIQRSNIDDDVLMSLTALDIELEPARITASGVNKLIHKWKRQSVPLKSQFVYYLDDPKDFPLAQLVLNIRDVSYGTPELAFIPMCSNRILQVSIDLSSVTVACLRKS